MRNSIVFLAGLGVVSVACADTSDSLAAAVSNRAHAAPVVSTGMKAVATPASEDIQHRSVPSFLGIPDGPIRDKLASLDVVKVEPGRGGRSVAFRLTLSDGSQGYFKPEQTFSGAHWYAEIAAYYLDRALGFNRTPPVVSRVLPWKLLQKFAPKDGRATEIVFSDKDVLKGALVGWVPAKITSLKTPTGWEGWVRFAPWPATAATPYQRARVYVDQAQSRKKGDIEGVSAPKSAKGHRESPELASPELAASLSDLILFDYLTNNIDRWGGHNTNVLTVENGPLIFLDNAAAFPLGVARNGVMDARLHVVQKFRKKTVEAVRALDLIALQAEMARDPLAPLLPPKAWEHLEERRRYLLEHVEKMQTRFGDAVFAW